jgi:hypothetical protein
MSLPFEPDDVDIFVNGGTPTPEEVEETRRAIEEHKRRPGHQAEVEEAKRILARLGIDIGPRGKQRAQELLEHWHRVRAELEAEDRAEANGVGDHAGQAAETPRDKP